MFFLKKPEKNKFYIVNAYMPLVKIKTGTHVRVEIIFTKINLSIKT